MWVGPDNGHGTGQHNTTHTSIQFIPLCVIWIFCNAKKAKAKYSACFWRKRSVVAKCRRAYIVHIVVRNRFDYALKNASRARARFTKTRNLWTYFWYALSSVVDSYFVIFFFFSRWMTQRTEHSTHFPYLAFWLVALTAFSACLNSPLMTWWKCDSHPQPTQHHTINLPSGTIENDTWQFSLHHNSHFHFNTNNYFHPNLLNRNGGCYFAFKIQSLNVERDPEGRTVARFALWVIKVRE